MSPLITSPSPKPSVMYTVAKFSVEGSRPTQYSPMAAQVESFSTTIGWSIAAK